MSSYRYSFSGADATMWCYFPQLASEVRRIEAIHTISFSVFEAKAPVRALGHKSVKGFTRSIRTIGGSMICLVINNHPLTPLLELIPQAFENNANYPSSSNYGWSKDQALDGTGLGTAFDRTAFSHRLPTLIPPFTLELEYVSEMGLLASPGASLGSPVSAGGGGTVEDAFLAQISQPGGALSFGNPLDHAKARLEGIEFISDGVVTSVNDMVTEVTFQFVARNYFPVVFDKPSDPAVGFTSIDTSDKAKALAAKVFREMYPISDKPYLTGAESQGFSEKYTQSDTVETVTTQSPGFSTARFNYGSRP